MSGCLTALDKARYPYISNLIYGRYLMTGRNELIMMTASRATPLAPLEAKQLGGGSKAVCSFT